MSGNAILRLFDNKGNMSTAVSSWNLLSKIVLADFVPEYQILLHLRRERDNENHRKAVHGHGQAFHRR